MKKLLFLRPFSPLDEKYLKESLSDLYDLVIPNSFDDDTMLKYISEVDVCIGNNISETILNKATNLKLVQFLGTGINHLDLNSLAKYKSIKFCNSYSSGKYVAEHAVAMMFSLLKKVHLHDEKMRLGEWFKPTGTVEDAYFTSDSLQNKTIGFLGFGNIGQSIQKFLQGFDNPILINSNSIEKVEKNLYVSKEELFKKSDIIFISLPLTNNTKNIVDENLLALMKDSAYIINVSRGAIINENALYSVLSNNKIKGAAIDVWWGNEYTKDGKKYPSSKHEFHKLKNLLLSPYRAAYNDGVSPHMFDVVKNLVNYAKNGSLINIIDINKGY